MTIKYVIIGIITIAATMIPTSVSATGIRHDPGDDATIEESRCWRDGYDSYGCEDLLRTKEECGELTNNPNRDRRI